MSFEDHVAQRQQFRQGLASRHGAEDEGVGNAEVDAQDVMDYDELYDSERLAISRVMDSLSQSIGTPREGSAFQREVRDRFAEIGFVVRCDLKKDENDPRDWDDRPWIPDISIIGRTEKQGEFDHERMGHEVRSNIIGEKGRDSTQKTQVGQTGFTTTSGIIVPGR